MGNSNILELSLVQGVPSATSLGQTTITEPVPVPFVLHSDTVGSPLKLADQGGMSGWMPAVTTLKNGGVWTESNTSDGRTLVSAPLGNVTETLPLLLVDTRNFSKASLLTKLTRFIEAARSFHADEFATQPVYLAIQYRGSPGVQYALVYNIDIAPEVDPFEDELTSSVTLTIEREPEWRGIAPGDNPKVWGFYKKGWIPSSDSGATVSPGQYDYTTLSLISALANNETLDDGLIYPFDEIGTSNVNYIDIPGTLIDGDCPAAALIAFKAKTTGVAKLHVARDTRTDLYPANNNNATTQRKRNTFNGGDCTVTSVNPTSVKTIDANGVLSNGSIVNRYVLVLTYAAGTISGQAVASWSRVISQYPGRYAAYLRAQVTAGTVANTKFLLTWSTGATNINLQQTDAVRLNQSGYGLTYLGDVDFTLQGAKYISHLGQGIDVSTTFTLNLHTTKTSAETSTIKVWDVVLMPIDEPNGVVIINFASLGVNDYAFLDKTGYFTGGKIQDVAATVQSSVMYQRRMTGQAIELIPGVNNRLYILPDLNSAAPTVPHELQVSIVPKWALFRDV